MHNLSGWIPNSRPQYSIRERRTSGRTYLQRSEKYWILHFWSGKREEIYRKWSKRIRKKKCYINTVNNYSRRECPNKVDPSTAPVEKRVSPTPDPACIYNRRPFVSYAREKPPQTPLSASRRPNWVVERERGGADTWRVVVVVTTMYIYIYI